MDRRHTRNETCPDIATQRACDAEKRALAKVNRARRLEQWKSLRGGPRPRGFWQWFAGILR